MRLPVDRFLNFVHSWCLERIKPEDREEWTMQMEMPLPGSIVREPSEAQLEREFESWGSLLASQGRSS